MSGLRFAFDEDLVIPLPPDPLAPGVGAAWAADAAARFSRLAPDATERLQRALLREQAAIAGSVDGGTRGGFVAVDPVTSSFASVRLAVVDGALPPEQRQTFLRPPSTLPAVLRPGPSNSFGEGCSSAFPLAELGGSGEIRWLWVATDASLLASAAPIRLAATLSIGAVSEAVLRSVIVDDVIERRQAPDFMPADLITANAKEQPGWRE